MVFRNGQYWVVNPKGYEVPVGTEYPVDLDFSKDAGPVWGDAWS